MQHPTDPPLPSRFVPAGLTYDRGKPRVDFVPEHARQWGATVGMTTFYLCLSGVSAICGYQWTSVVRRAETYLMRTDLVLKPITMGLGAYYLVIQTALTASSFTPLSNGFSRTLAFSAEALQIASCCPVPAGVSVPTTPDATHRCSWSKLWRLASLWHDLTIPPLGTACQLPASWLQEVTPTGPPPDVCADRGGQTIADTAASSGPYPHPATATWRIETMPCAAAASEPRGVPSPALLAKPITDAGTPWLLGTHEVCAIRTQARTRYPLHSAKEPAR